MKFCLGYYRYGFNGKEKDVNGEWGESTTAYDYGFRIYNPSIGKFLSVDPLSRKFASLTPYQFASNMPIVSIDMDGLETYTIHSATITADLFASALTGATSDELLRKVELYQKNGYKGKAYEKYAETNYEGKTGESSDVVTVSAAPEGSRVVIYGFTNATDGKPIKFAIFSSSRGYSGREIEAMGQELLNINTEIHNLGIKIKEQRKEEAHFLNQAGDAVRGFPDPKTHVKRNFGFGLISAYLASSARKKASKFKKKRTQLIEKRQSLIFEIVDDSKKKAQGRFRENNIQNSGSNNIQESRP